MSQSDRPKSPFAAFDFAKLFGDWRQTAFDPKMLIAMQQQCFDGFLEVNQKIASGYRDLGTQQVEVLWDALAALETVQAELARGGQDAGLPQKQLEQARAAFQTALDATRELVDQAGALNEEAVALISRRLRDVANEFKDKG